MRLYLIAVAAILFCLVQSCKEGCKDKTAINYDSHARVENGTCLYCNGGASRDTATYFFNFSNSINFSGNDVEFIVISSNSGLWGNGCQTEGKTEGSVCKNYLSVVNLTGDRMESNFFEAQFTQNDTDVWFYNNSQNFVLSAPGQGSDTLNFGLVDSFGCSNLITGTLSINDNSFNWFP